MQTVTVVEVERYRDGGTIKYRDELNRLYYKRPPMYKDDKVYNDFPEMVEGTNQVKPYIGVILVHLLVVEALPLWQ